MDSHECHYETTGAHTPSSTARRKTAPGAEPGAAAVAGLMPNGLCQGGYGPRAEGWCQRPYEHPAAGRGTAHSVLGVPAREREPVRGSRAILTVNHGDRGFDCPGCAWPDDDPYAEVLGGLHHIAISVEPGQWHRLVAKLDEAGIEHEMHSKVSVYSRDPDGARIEPISDPLGEMYGDTVR
ncbi:VOC family protein [Sciscionella marina]|uniref:VOC family protein n=1 Tax=Sciscionella marina TaxID=508770 RepID=UPI0003A6229E|nr:hypothetical protein [Sciscionella marina]